MDKKITTIIIAAMLVALAGGGMWFFVQNRAGSLPGGQKTAPKGPVDYNKIKSFDDCVAAGYPVMETYPRSCKLPDGNDFWENIGNEPEMKDTITIDSPRPNAKISSPLQISGQARGNWYFEAQFPVKLMDENGQELATGIAQAQGDWMTEEFVPFTATLEFSQPATAAGTLLLQNDNPSGLPTMSKELFVPIKF